MFKKIFEKIQQETMAIVGSTGYLDMMPWGPPAKGVDQHGRPFFVLPVRVVEEHRYGMGTVFVQERTGMVCFFKRYSDPSSSVWVTATSHIAGNGANPVLTGALQNPDNGVLEELLLKILDGQESEFLFEKGWKDGTYYKFRARLPTAEEIEKVKRED